MTTESVYKCTSQIFSKIVLSSQAIWFALHETSERGGKKNSAIVPCLVERNSCRWMWRSCSAKGDLQSLLIGQNFLMVGSTLKKSHFFASYQGVSEGIQTGK